MPTYDYECSACGHGFEALQSMRDPKLTKCPKCGKSKLQRLIGSGAGMIFKGSGFYETDYKRKTEPKSESKPAEKPAAKSSGCGCAGGGHSCQS
ncbi:MAG: zinc ribbon domain-containing protein [Candidatus Omnitrophica bacterium]|nr:zinc ribbon domain-containing protein [Candidatus Omnitrophota bacterium]